MNERDAHERYEELVAGYALSALEPEDEQLLLRHLPTCAACERDLALHQATLAHLAYAGEAVTPPSSLWQDIRAEVLASSSPAAFGEQPQGEAEQPARDDLAAVRARRQARRRRAAGWLAAAAALVLVLGLGGWNLVLHRDLDRQGRVSDRLTAAVQALEAGPGQAIPLSDDRGKVAAVAVVRGSSVALIVDGLPANDPADSVYVLWGKHAASDAPAAMATFDIRGGGLQVVRNPTLAPSLSDPSLLLITREPGRSAPAQTHQPAVVTGRSA